MIRYTREADASAWRTSARCTGDCHSNPDKLTSTRAARPRATTGFIRLLGRARIPRAPRRLIAAKRRGFRFIRLSSPSRVFRHRHPPPPPCPACGIADRRDHAPLASFHAPGNSRAREKAQHRCVKVQARYETRCETAAIHRKFNFRNTRQSRGTEVRVHVCDLALVYVRADRVLAV